MSSNEWYSKNKNDKEFMEHRREIKRRAIAKNPDAYKQHNRMNHKKTLDMDHERFFKNRIETMRKRARKINQDCVIDWLYLKEIFPQDRKCPILDIPFKTGDEGGRFNSPSIDRIDNSKGYEKGNVIWVSHLANCIKTSATPCQIITVGEFYKQLEEENAHE